MFGITRQEARVFWITFCGGWIVLCIWVLALSEAVEVSTSITGKISPVWEIKDTPEGMWLCFNNEEICEELPEQRVDFE